MRLPAAALVLTLVAPASAAKPVRPVDEQTKIDFLIGEVKRSPAVFIRNGREYRSDRAAAHLARKLRFAGQRVQTARQFIVGIATQSSETGKPYEIRWPDGKRQRLSDWLYARLGFYEEARPARAAS